MRVYRARRCARAAACGSGCLADAQHAVRACGIEALPVVVPVSWRPLGAARAAGAGPAAHWPRILGLAVLFAVHSVRPGCYPGGAAKGTSLLSTRSIGGVSPPSQPRAALAVANVTCRGKTVHLLGGPLLAPFASSFTGARLAFPLWRTRARLTQQLLPCKHQWRTYSQGLPWKLFSLLTMAALYACTVVRQS